jgi:hypothetical protein
MTVKVEFGIERWSFWSPPVAGAVAEVPEVPPLLRRRASPVDRAALRVAFDVAGAEAKLPSIFCSRHGEVARSVEMLEGLTQGQGISPTTFSLSVHNAPAAVFSITRGDMSPSSSLSAEWDSVPSGVVEAVLRFQEGEPKVLLVAYEDTLPDAFAAYQDEERGVMALALLLTASGHPRYTLELEAGAGARASEPHLLSLSAFLKEGSSTLSVASLQRRWTWTRHG